MAIGLVMMVIGIFLVLVGVCSGPATPPPVPTPTWGEKIAVIDGERMDSTHARRADYLLASISSKCRNSGLGHLGDMAVITQQVLFEGYGVEVDILEVLEGVNKQLILTGHWPHSCADVFEVYGVLRGQ